MSKDLINSFKRYLMLEQGLSSNTIEAYLTDVQKLIDFADNKGVDVRSIEESHLEEFLADLHDQGLSARSTARVISGIKSFFRYMGQQDVEREDPSALLVSPK